MTLFTAPLVSSSDKLWQSEYKRHSMEELDENSVKSRERHYSMLLYMINAHISCSDYISVIQELHVKLNCLDILIKRI